MIYKLQIQELGSSDFVRMAEIFYKESGLPGIFKQERFIASWEQFYNLNIGAIWVACEDLNEPIHGAIGGLIHPDLYDGELVTQELFWFVEPVAAFRDAINLYQALESWAIERGSKRLNMACVCNKHMASVRRFYEKRGFRPVDVSYIKFLT